ncbi:hypothetical protein MUN89_08940 [Halobacillus salinarum]|uniref:SCP2 domain-containing protein n=1 Tax=Halobacillus salinarum TaxID=2932257 RepID=A0ABY4EQ79_9BACI|nr:hypothetical protein [Halobacillus salinarum]UOQ46023.1 hypothetical protein MUN89_08940 [Halobacillus salinarum]
MVEFINLWIKRVNERKDLIPTWRERHLTLEVHAIPAATIQLFIDKNGVQTEPPEHIGGKIRLTSTQEMFHSLLTGDQKLTNLPKEQMTIKGSYRNVLFLESLFLLSK